MTTPTACFFHNISGICLTHSEVKLLNKGLKFIVAPPCLPDSLYLQAFNKFARSIRLKYSFFTNPDTNINTLYIPNPDYMPPLASRIIENYISICRTHLLNLLDKYPAHSTKVDEQRKVSRIAKELEDKQLVIKPADKNLGPVVMNIVQYNKLCLKFV